VCVPTDLAAMIMKTCRPRSSKFEDALEGNNRSRLKEHMVVVNLEAVD